ncbi:MAG: ROK family protein [Actinomycetota bacterium]|nr:ROK family protein [Actinomycetota bacterium]
MAEHIDAYGDLIARAEIQVGRPARPEGVAAALARAVDAACSTARGCGNAGVLGPAEMLSADTEQGSGGVGLVASSSGGAVGSAEKSGPGSGGGVVAGWGVEGVPGSGRDVVAGSGGVGAAGSGVEGVPGSGRDVVAGSRGDGAAGSGAEGVPGSGGARAVGTDGARAVGSGGVRARLAVVSAADPVDRHSGRLVQLPDAPFLLGEIDPVAVLEGRVDGPVHVDNDVNWAAEAERKANPLDDFAYVYLDEGLGCAILSDGEVRRGHHGLAGEVAHLITVGPGGRAMPLIEVFGELGLRRAGGGTAIDVDRLLAERPREVVTAVGGLVAALATLIDPETVVIGGRWGTALIDEIRRETSQLPRAVHVRAASVDDEPSLSGARADALRRLQELIVGR